MGCSAMRGSRRNLGKAPPSQRHLVPASDRDPDANHIADVIHLPPTSRRLHL